MIFLYVFSIASIIFQTLYFLGPSGPFGVLRGPHSIVRAVISLLNIPGNSARTGTHQTVEWSPSGYDRFGGEGGPAALTRDYDSRLAGGAPEAKGGRSHERGSRRWARGLPEREGPDSRLGNTTSGVTPRRTQSSRPAFTDRVSGYRHSW